MVVRRPFKHLIEANFVAGGPLNAEQRRALSSLEAHDAHCLVGQAIADRSFDLMWALRFTTMNVERLGVFHIGEQVTTEPIADAERSLKFLRHYVEVAEAQLEARRSDEG